MRLHPILTVSGLTDPETPYLQLATTCSACQATIALTQFDCRDPLFDLDKLAGRHANEDAEAFLSHASEIHGVSKPELGLPIVMLEI